MARINFTVFSFAAILSLTGNTAFGQSNTISNPVVYDQQPQTAADINKLVPQDTYTLPWEPIKEDNILYKKRVWREIDLNDAENWVLGFNPETPRNSNFVNVLINGFFNSKYKAYSAVDDRFTTELSRAAFIELLAPGSKNAMSGYNPESISKFEIKEDWLFLENEHKMVVRIVGIAPAVKVLQPDGTSVDQPVFWLYYPDIRDYLAEHKVYKGKDAQGMNWDEFFEGRNFSSKIEKVSTQDNLSVGWTHSYKK